jgi:phosphatidylglycerol---prolipoprotein diacylglyceryl transferase
MLPILLQLPDGMTIFSYPLLMGMAWGVAYQLSLFQLEKNKISKKGFFLLYWGTFISAWIGAKVLFLLASSTATQRSLYAVHWNFWLGGGFVFYGGMIFASVFWLLYSLFYKKIPISRLSLFLPAVAFGHGVGRIGCFLAGCCYGKVCQLPWSIHLHGMNRHPVQLYEAIGLFLLGIFFFRLLAKKGLRTINLAYYLLGYGVLRLIIEFFRGDKIRGLYYDTLTTSQIISIIMIIIGAIWIRFIKKGQPQL